MMIDIVVVYKNFVTIDETNHGDSSRFIFLPNFIQGTLEEVFSPGDFNSSDYGLERLGSGDGN